MKFQYLQLVSSALVPPVLITSNVFVIQVAQRQALGNTCETCGEDFESRWNKLHQHLGDTGHAMLRARIFNPEATNPPDGVG
ncbi:hypothetical protein CK203_069440 [Vitis vinifera]|uniref:Uncharacterized protein n=1 Tax=Vitis vinifera TaxID=29760 RepID=A0A438BZY1_VITVI|nr:hypothetical protein CK203_069440 [Vitis vinifera]